MKKLIEILKKHEATVAIAVMVACALFVVLGLARDYFGASTAYALFMLIAAAVYYIRQNQRAVAEQDRQFDTACKNSVVYVLNLALEALVPYLHLPNNESKGFSSIEQIIGENGVRVYRVQYLRMPDSPDIPPASWCQLRDVLAKSISSDPYIQTCLQPRGLYVSKLVVSGTELVIIAVPLIDTPSCALAQTLEAAITRDRSAGSTAPVTPGGKHKKIFDDEL